jgi:putative hydrolase of the HAD superfamily
MTRHDAGPRTAPNAVLFDFGGVLTTSVLDAFATFGEALGDAGLPLKVLGEDPEGAALLVDHEEGRIGQVAFERGFAGRLTAYGAEVDPEGLVDRLQSAMKPDRETIALIGDLRAEGRPVGLLSNSLGDNCYAGFDLFAIFDAVTISAEIGVRKPSRLAYVLACERLGVAPESTVMVDDLRDNIDAAARLGMAGVVHRSACTTREELRNLLAPPPSTTPHAADGGTRDRLDGREETPCSR